MILSIVLTVYNKAPFLRRALDSLISQDCSITDQYEIIVVNDGSSDNSGTIIKEYDERYDCLRVITQDNQGLSRARNNGVLEAKGDYVWFVDADDSISAFSVRLICEATTNKPDIIPIYAITEGKTEIRNHVPPEAKNGRDLLISKKWQPCGVFNIFRRSFLLDNGLCFLPGIYHEDCEFTPRALFLAKSVKVIPEVLYTVIHEPNSITQIPRYKRAYDYLIVAESLSLFAKEYVSDDILMLRVFNDFTAIMINNAFDIIVKNDYSKQKDFNVFFSKKRLLRLQLFNSTKYKYRIEALLFSLFPKRCVDVYKYLKMTH